MILLLLACAGDDRPKPDADDSGALPAECAPGPAVAPTGPWFTEVTAEAGLDAALTYGFGRMTVVDLDGDHHDDPVGVPAHDGGHAEPPGDLAKLALRAVGDGTFEDWTARSGLADAEVGLMVFGDVDNDGGQDLFGGTIQSAGLDDVGIWLNDGAGTFSHAGRNGIEPEQLACGSYTCTENPITATFADFNQDGALDLYLGGWYWSDGETDLRYSPPPRDKLYQGNGDGTFTDRTRRLGDQTHPEQGASDSFGRAAMGVAPGDHDNDGDLDLVAGSIAHADYVQSDRTLLFVNQGGAEPTFTEESLERGLTWREDETHRRERRERDSLEEHRRGRQPLPRPAAGRAGAAGRHRRPGDPLLLGGDPAPRAHRRARPLQPPAPAGGVLRARRGHLRRVGHHPLAGRGGAGAGGGGGGSGAPGGAGRVGDPHRRAVGDQGSGARASLDDCRPHVYTVYIQ